MQLHDFLIPSQYTISEGNTMNIIVYTAKQKIDASGFDACIIGFTEDRNSNNKGAGLICDSIRKELYSLQPTSKRMRILDLGNCVLGKTVQESYLILEEVCKIVKKYKKPIIVIGGTQDALLPISKEITHGQKFPSVAIVDSYINIETHNNDFHNLNCIQKIFELDKRIRISHIAHQEFLSNSSSVSWFQEKYFPVLRLGEITNDIVLAEPLLRDAQVVEFDSTALSSIYCNANIKNYPTGLSAYQASQLAWYSGYSPNMQVFHVSEFNSKSDICLRTISTLLWYVFDGISQRFGALDAFSDDSFTYYYIKNSFLDYDLRVFESKITKQLWVEVPLRKTSKKRIIPCSRLDYQMFLQDELPEMWLLEFNRVFKK